MAGAVAVAAMSEPTEGALVIRQFANMALMMHHESDADAAHLKARFWAFVGGFPFVKRPALERQLAALKVENRELKAVSRLRREIAP